MRSKPKDFSILMTKVSAANNKKDIGMVSNYNKIVQQIEQAAKVNKGELMADPFFGSNYFQFSFDGIADVAMMRTVIKDSIEYAIPDLINVSVELLENTETSLIFDINFTLSDFLNTQNNINCVIEVPTV